MTGSASRPRLLTAEEFAAGGSRYDHCELWDGALCVHDPSGGEASHVGQRIVGRLWGQGAEGKTGWLFGADQGFLVQAHPPRVLAPDVAYVARARLAALPKRGFLPLAPDFVVEVRSPDDRWVAVVEKCGRWIAHGVSVVWAVDPLERLVVVFRGAEPPVEAHPGDVVDGAPALPEFRLAVADLFAGLG